MIGGSLLMKQTILIIEDEEAIADILSYSLKKEGFLVFTASTGTKGLEIINGVEIDLVLLDLMLPDMTGFDICRKIVSISSIPIIMLTARDDIVDKVTGLELGAMDYITKPFDIREVIARIRVSLRNTTNNTKHKFIVINEEIKLDPTAYTVYKNNEIIPMKRKEYELLLLFAQNKNRLFSREEILDYVWDMDYEGGLRTVDVHIQRIRKKLDASIIQTVFGAGYKLNG